MHRARLGAPIDGHNHCAFVGPAPVRQRALVIGAHHQEAQVALGQGGVGCSQSGERLVVRQQLVVGVSAQVGPGIGAPVVGIVVAGQTNLVAVVDHRRAGHRELDQRRQLNAPHPLGQVVRVELTPGRRLVARGERPQHPLCVVAVEQVEQRVVGGRGVILLLRKHPRREVGR